MLCCLLLLDVLEDSSLGSRFCTTSDRLESASSRTTKTEISIYIYPIFTLHMDQILIFDKAKMENNGSWVEGMRL